MYDGYWAVWCYNQADAQFGYDPGPVVYIHGLEPAVAKSIARHMNKKAPKFITYFAESQMRWC